MASGSEIPRVIIVGIYGNRGQKLARALLELSNFVKVVGGVDVSLVRPPNLPSELPVFPTLEQALSRLSFDVAILATPTGHHFDQVQLLLKSGVHVIKEKPFETRFNKARRLAELAIKANLSLFVLTQRAYYPTYVLAGRLWRRIQPFRFEMFISVDARKSNMGWRAIPELALGGVVSDLGYHALDLIVRYFGVPDGLCGMWTNISDKGRYRKMEDAADYLMSFRKHELAGILKITRLSPSSREYLFIQGRSGSIKASTSTLLVTRYRKGADCSQIWKRSEQVVKWAALKHILTRYLRALGDRKKTKEHLQHHLNVVRLLENCYKESHRLDAPIKQLDDWDGR